MMKYAVLRQVVDELSKVLPGSRADKIVPLENGGLCFRFRSGKKMLQLLVSPDRSLPRFHLISRQPKASEHPSPFYLQVRKHVLGARIAGTAVLGSDRIVEMRFERSGSQTLIFFELFGSKSNLILADEQRKIEAVLYPAAPGMTKGRALLPGLLYEAPELKAVPARSESLLEPTMAAVDTASEIAVNLSVESWFEKLIKERWEASERRRLRKIVERELARVERRSDAVMRDLETSERSGEYRKLGELILANLGSIRKGQDRCDVQDFTGEPVSIPLDPLLTASGNAERYFKRYKKAKAGNAVLRERLERARSEADLLRALQRDLIECLPDGLERISAVLRDRGFDAEDDTRTGRRRPVLSAPYRIITFKGWDILIGKSAAGNDYITMILAKPDDLWLHAEGMAGSHVLVRNPGKREVPDDVLRKAASLAAFYSKGKGSTRVPVAYTDAKYVRKPKGAKPGLVVLAQRRTIMSAPEAS